MSEFDKHENEFNSSHSELPGKIHPELDLPEPDKVSPEMSKASEEFIRSVHEIMTIRQQVAANMMNNQGKLSENEAKMNSQAAIKVHCIELEARVIDQEIYNSTHGEHPVDMSYLHWNLEATDSDTRFSTAPDGLIRVDRYSVDGKSYLHETTYTASEGYIFQDVIAEDEDGYEDGMDIDDEPDEPKVREGGPLSEHEAEVVARIRQVEGDFDSRALTLSEAKEFASLIKRLSEAIRKEYQRKGLLEPTKN